MATVLFRGLSDGNTFDLVLLFDNIIISWHLAMVLYEPSGKRFTASAWRSFLSGHRLGLTMGYSPTVFTRSIKKKDG